MHIGERIEAQLAEYGMTKAELARRIHTSRQNIDLILDKESIDTARLALICKVLKHDFFADLSTTPIQKKEATQSPKMILSVVLSNDQFDQSQLIEIIQKAI